MPNTKIKKVVALVEERFMEPEYIAVYKCPYCHTRYSEEVFDENITENITCENEKCKKKFKVKIPKYL